VKHLDRSGKDIRALKTRNEIGSLDSGASSTRQFCFTNAFQTFHVWLPSQCACGARHHPENPISSPFRGNTIDQQRKLTN
jgi:hypothetical protein